MAAEGAGGMSEANGTGPTTTPRAGGAGVKVAFVYPDFVMRRLFANPARLKLEPGGWYSDGLASLSASLKEAGHSTALLHLTRPAEREAFVGELRRAAPDIVAFTVRTSAVDICREYTEWTREALPGATVIWGGYHPTLTPETCIASPGVDAVCLGEGEGALVDLADAVAGEGDPRTIASLWYRDGSGAVHRNEVRPLVASLDELPLPDFALFDRGRLIASRTNTALVMLSRGCPYRCTYCTNHAFRKLYPNQECYHRSRSPEGAITCIDHLKAWYPGVKELRFLDNVFGITPRWLEEFGELYRRYVNLPFGCDLRVEGVREQSIRQLVEMGCTHVYIGIESGNYELRRQSLGRTMTDEQIVQAFELCRKYGLRTLAFNMVGMPGETPEDALATVKLNVKARTHSSIVSVFSPYPATVLHGVALERGYIGEELDYRDATFLDRPQLSRTAVAFMASYFNFLQGVYRRFGTEGGVSGFVDRTVLSRRLPRRPLIGWSERFLGLRDGLKSTVRNRMPGLFRLLRRVIKGR